MNHGATTSALRCHLSLAQYESYAALCKRFLPRPIHDQVGYDNTVEVADLFAGFENKMSRGQNDYFDILSDLIEKYDQDQVQTPKLSAKALLRHLANEHELSGADISRILGKSAPLGRMILRGERKITADHAVTFGKYFGLRTDAFIA